jgi:hypothetical protein
MPVSIRKIATGLFIATALIGAALIDATGHHARAAASFDWDSTPPAPDATAGV